MASRKNRVPHVARRKPIFLLYFGVVYPLLKAVI
jgi:hypothetical protein